MAELAEKSGDRARAIRELRALLAGVLATIVRLRKARSRFGSPDLLDGRQHDGGEHVEDMPPNNRVQRTAKATSH